VVAVASAGSYANHLLSLLSRLYLLVGLSTASRKIYTGVFVKLLAEDKEQLIFEVIVNQCREQKLNEYALDCV